MKSFINKFLIVFSILSYGLFTTAIYAADTAAILPNGKTVFLDSNGKPLIGGKVYFKIPATDTLKTTWQDAAETIPNANPVILDSAGRAIIWGFGSYRQQVYDKNSNLIWDTVTASAGSGTGGGTTSVGDGNYVGTVLPWSSLIAPTNYLFAYGQEINRIDYPEYLAAITSVQAAFCTLGSPVLSGLTDTTQIPINAPVEAACIAAGATVISKTVSSITVSVNANVSTNLLATIYPWGNGNGTTTFNVQDFRGRTLAGRDNMGGTAASRLTTTYFANADALGATGGSQSHTLTAAESAALTFTSTVTDPGHAHNAPFNGQFYSFVSSGGGYGTSGGTNVALGGATVASVTGITVATTSNAGGAAHSIVQPTITINYIVKVKPDSTLGTGTIVLSDLAAQANNTVIGNVSGVSATPIALTTTQLTALCNVFTSTLSGCTPGSGGGTVNYLRADGTWATPPGGVNIATGTGLTGGPITTTGTISCLTFGTSNVGCVPASGGGTVKYLRADGTWTAPAGSGNVSGPASSTTGDVAIFADTSGALLSDAGFAPIGAATTNTLTNKTYNTASTGNTFTLSSSVAGFLALANGGLGASQVAATNYQVPIFPGSSGAAVPGFIDLGAAKGTVQGYNLGSEANFNSYYTNNGLAVPLVAGRIMVGTVAAQYDGSTTPPSNWISTLWSGANLLQLSQFASVSTLGTQGVTGFTRGSDADGWAPAGGNASALAVAGWAYSDSVAGVGNSTWAGYFENAFKSGAVGSALGIEIDIANFNSFVADLIPTAMAPAHLNADLWLACGGLAAGTQNCGAAIGIVSNTKQFRKGIVFMNTALDTSLGTGGAGVAIEMYAGQSIVWSTAGGTVQGELWTNASGYMIAKATTGFWAVSYFTGAGTTAGVTCAAGISATTGRSINGIITAC